jgi:hypothetical protein
MLAHHLDNPETARVNGETKVDDDDGWHLVGTFKTTTTDIKHYYVVPSKINIDNYVSSILSIVELTHFSVLGYRFSSSAQSREESRPGIGRDLQTAYRRCQCMWPKSME